MCLCNRLSGGSWNVFTSAEPQPLLSGGTVRLEMALDPPLEEKQCSQFDKFWHMQGVRKLCIKFITSELNLLSWRKLITFKEIYYRQYSNSQGHWGLNEGVLLFVLLVFVWGFFFQWSYNITKERKLNSTANF